MGLTQTEQGVITVIEIIRLPEVMRITGRSRSAIYSDICAGRFPSQVHIGRRSVGWVKGRIERHLEGLISESDKEGKRKLSRKRVRLSLP